jgi:hypothetical protein
MRIAVAASLFAFSSMALAKDRWLEFVPEDQVRVNWIEVSTESFSEVSTEKFVRARKLVKSSVFLAIDNALAATLTDPGLKCADATRPFLLRASYLHAGTGSFRLYWAGSTLIVAHESLGGGVQPSKSLIVACLPIAPKQVLGYVASDL